MTLKSAYEKMQNIPKFKLENLIYNTFGNSYSKTFHNRCDNKKNLIVLIQINNGDIIGGFTSVGWDITDNGFVSDPNAFLFNVTKEKIYKIKPDKINNAICNENDFGPSFGTTLRICNECDINEDSFCKLGMEGTEYESNGDDCGTFLGYESSKKTVEFLVENYEVYKMKKIENENDDLPESLASTFKKIERKDNNLLRCYDK
jgi:hypothetical protein